MNEYTCGNKILEKDFKTSIGDSWLMVEKKNLNGTQNFEFLKRLFLKYVLSKFCKCYKFWKILDHISCNTNKILSNKNDKMNC